MRPQPAVVGALALLLAGCSTGGGAGSATATAPETATRSLFAQAPPTCAPATTAALTWPKGVPADLPKPPAATAARAQDRSDGLTVVTFSTASNLREGVLFLVKALPAAGYTLGRGDAEATEADVPFVKAGLRGVLRMVAVEQCRTDWLMALAEGSATTGGSPLLPSRPSSSPLPFG
jgi:hypothetical protein